MRNTKALLNNEIPVQVQLFRLIVFFLLAFLFVNITTLLFMKFVFKMDLLQLDFNNPDMLAVAKFLQFWQVLFLFGIPALLMSLFLKQSFFRFYLLDKKPEYKAIAFATALVLVVIPFNDWLIRMNESMSLPESWQNLENLLRSAEDRIAKQMEAFLVMDNVKDIFLNILIIAILPALMEELFFRGLIQGLLVKWLKNPHVSIVIAAVFFSAVHMQFYGFLPRLLLGLFLGYLYFWTRNLWTAIFFHFINNFLSLLVAYFVQHSLVNEQKIEEMNQSNFAIIISFAITAALLLFLANFYSKRRNKENDWKCVFVSDMASEVEIMQGRLQSEGIDAVVMNKRDSSYTSFGKVELLVKPIDFDVAKEILEKATDE
jgi:membrane protease YdiL (CAAX protease family)